MRHCDPPCDRCGREWYEDWKHEADLTDAPEPRSIKDVRNAMIPEDLWLARALGTFGTVALGLSGEFPFAFFVLCVTILYELVLRRCTGYDD